MSYDKGAEYSQLVWLVRPSHVKREGLGTLVYPRCVSGTLGIQFSSITNYSNGVRIILNLSITLNYAVDKRQQASM